MSKPKQAVNELLAAQVEKLTTESDRLTHQNKRLAELLAEALGILDNFKSQAEDKLRHYERSPRGRFDPEKLLDR